MKTFFHHTLIDGVERTWTIDAVAAAGVAAWIARTPPTFEADLAGMAEYFPHWLLAGSSGGRPAACLRCGVVCVPSAGAIRCVKCGDGRSADGLVWLGHIPALARPERPFVRRLAALRALSFPETTVGEATYLLVPLTVRYPAEWPNVEPAVSYAGRWLDALGLPRTSAAHHIIGNGQACLFAWSQWSAMPIHAVLQQRVVNHITSLLKIAAGQPPHQAFIGRIHHDDWQPSGP